MDGNDVGCNGLIVLRVLACGCLWSLSGFARELIFILWQVAMSVANGGKWSAQLPWASFQLAWPHLLSDMPKVESPPSSTRQHQHMQQPWRRISPPPSTTKSVTWYWVENLLTFKWLALPGAASARFRRFDWTSDSSEPRKPPQMESDAPEVSHLLCWAPCVTGWLRNPICTETR